MLWYEQISVGIALFVLAHASWAQTNQGEYATDGDMRSPWFDSLNVSFVGNWPFGPSYAVAYDTARSLVFCSSGGGIYVFDASQPSDPVIIGEMRARGWVQRFCYDDTEQIIYSADGRAGLCIWNVADPYSPVKLSDFGMYDQARGVFVDGNYAYVANGEQGLRIINVSSPSNPFEVGYFNTSGNACDVYVVYPHAFVASGWLRVIDVSDPTDPHEIGFCSSPSLAVKVRGDYAYVAAGSQGLCIIDITDRPPHTRSAHTTPLEGHSMSTCTTRVPTLPMVATGCVLCAY